MTNPNPPLGPLGQTSYWPQTLAPELLYAVSRADARRLAGIAADDADVSHGEDTWTAWEFCWRTPQGWPLARVVQLVIPADSPNIVESKSLKLYLHGFAEQRMTPQQVQARLQTDLSRTLGSPLRIELLALDDPRLQVVAAPESCVDAQPVLRTSASEEKEGLQSRSGPPCRELLGSPLHGDGAWVSHTFGSLCPVTGQPDWASVRLRWQGQGPSAAGLVAYLTAFRHHRGFHEACVEQIWHDIWHCCGCTALSVRAQFTRRGGIDIAPARSAAHGQLLPWCRLARQ